MSIRCGIGYDLHRLEEGRKLIVGGIELPRLVREKNIECGPSALVRLEEWGVA